MLKLINIKKDYKVGDTAVHALKGVSINFRKSEFVSVLGPSGCGKTTLLNIIGGLDHYTSGDLIINGVSTEKFNDRDWDTYRNHSIGFVFQSYNLIPHQTVSENVELALTISGVDKAERVRRAHEALDKVGLKGQYKKKPNQLSGGQCQRVAIARALVNNPEILLADEPTGALDTETSVQIMDLIQEVSKDGRVIMGTRNPELAERYSTRIVKLLDGEMVEDTDPFDGVTGVGGSETENEQAEAAPEPNAEYDGEIQPSPSAAEQPVQADANQESAKPQKPNKKAKLSLWGAFKLSAKNLLSKFKRTFLVCLAGSIGIIGVATVLAVSSGVQNFIHSMQNDMLSGNPVTISSDALDMNAMLSSATKQQQSAALHKAVQDGYVNVDMFIEYLVSRSDDLNSFMIHNDITDEYLEFVRQMPKSYYAEIAQSYGLNLSNNLYTEYGFEGSDGKVISVTAATAMFESMLKDTEFAEYAQYISMFTTQFRQAPNNADFILSQYEFITPAETSKIPTEENEIMLVVSKQTELTDLMLAQYGYYTQEEFFNLVYKATGSESYRDKLFKDKFSNEELVNKTFTWYPNDTVFNKTPTFSPLKDANPFTYNAYADSSWEGGRQLKITGILRPKKDTNYGCLSAGFYYTDALSRQIIKSGVESEIVAYLNGNNREFYSSMENDGMYLGITYDYAYTFEGTRHEKKGLVGSSNAMYSFMGNMMGQQVIVPYNLTKRELGGVTTPSSISVYPKDFNLKSSVCAYLDGWNSDKDIVVDGKTLTKEERGEITYTDNLSIVINMVNDFIDIVTAALVAFTALSLVVSTVMIAIITYVSVIERVKEIGVIRSLGGRKRDVSALFNAETFIIGGASGIIGIAVTYIISAVLNLIIKLNFGISSIAALPIPLALLMIAISIGLTLISGLIPARLAAKKDPVDALRTE